MTEYWIDINISTVLVYFLYIVLLLIFIFILNSLYIQYWPSILDKYDTNIEIATLPAHCTFCRFIIQKRNSFYEVDILYYIQI